MNGGKHQKQRLHSAINAHSNHFSMQIGYYLLNAMDLVKELKSDQSIALQTTFISIYCYTNNRNSSFNNYVLFCFFHFIFLFLEKDEFTQVICWFTIDDHKQKLLWISTDFWLGNNSQNYIDSLNLHKMRFQPFLQLDTFYTQKRLRSRCI